jgi:hypothetical protein
VQNRRPSTSGLYRARRCSVVRGCSTESTATHAVRYRSCGVVRLSPQPPTQSVVYFGCDGLRLRSHRSPRLGIHRVRTYAQVRPAVALARIEVELSRLTQHSSRVQRGVREEQGGEHSRAPTLILHQMWATGLSTTTATGNHTHYAGVRCVCEDRRHDTMRRGR